MFVCFLKAGPLLVRCPSNSFVGFVFVFFWKKYVSDGQKAHAKVRQWCLRGHRICVKQLAGKCHLRTACCSCSCRCIPNTSAALNNFPSSPVNKYTRPGNYSGYHAPNRYLNTDFSISAPVGNLLKHPLCLHPRGIPTNSQRYHYRSGFPKNIPSKIV